jgi:hypothetical protein
MSPSAVETGVPVVPEVATATAQVTTQIGLPGKVIASKYLQLQLLQLN